jgi:hypothetical protein
MVRWPTFLPYTWLKLKECFSPTTIWISGTKSQNQKHAFNVMSDNLPYQQFYWPCSTSHRLPKRSVISYLPVRLVYLHALFASLTHLVFAKGSYPHDHSHTRVTQHLIVFRLRWDFHIAARFYKPWKILRQAIVRWMDWINLYTCVHTINQKK